MSFPFARKTNFELYLCMIGHFDGRSVLADADTQSIRIVWQQSRQQRSLMSRLFG